MNLYYSWHKNDPVSDKELNRNNAVYKLQKNRNPYIDHPEWADYIFKGIEPKPDTKVLQKIEISGTASKTSYYNGDNFNLSGLTITAFYSTDEGQATENVTKEVTVSPATLTTGTTSVTLSYTYGTTTKSAVYSGITVTDRPINYGTLDNPLSVSQAKSLIESQCTTTGSYTKQQIYCKGTFGSFVSEDKTNFKRKLYVSSSATSTMVVDSLTMTKDQYNLLTKGDEIIFHGYGCKDSSFIFKDKGTNY